MRLIAIDRDGRGAARARKLIARRCPRAGPLALAAACFATAAAAQPRAPAPARDRAAPYFQFSPLPLERGLALFRTLCVRAFPDADALERAVRAIDPDIGRSESGLPSRYYWHSGRRFDLTYDVYGFREDAAWGRGEGTCELTLTVAGRLGPAALVARISARLAPRRQPVVRAGTVIWHLTHDNRDRLEYRFSAPERRLSLTRRLSRGR
ncbi:MAG: hypothetical protein QOD42_2038 [Sphingomonadales bacterium]|jgi:hypothetical protein|nr:hypothetical protein [Sphingomonadales bacterium]